MESVRIPSDGLRR